MGTLYFFSGFDKERGFTPEIAQSLRESITVRESLVFIASSPSGHAKTDLYTGAQTTWFQNAGITFKRIYVLDDRTTAPECAKIIENASAIFLCGGTTLPQIEFLRENSLIPLLRQSDSVIMGMSAGAINMAVHAFYSADEDHGQTHIYEGIGLADISIEPHFSIDNAGLIERDLLPFSKKIEIFAMCDDSAIAVLNGKRQLFGDIHQVSKGSIKKIHSACTI